ncbi:response regulator [Novisyntrophococcus fermenticellae]|uniref:response regulator n=1 Tax=Novisyntrophococcus fermenticellae TaxID=2068655 RepID=UPI001E4D3C6A|nr:response regulator [Novisyntrophococcus fermenticellae]
MKAYRMLITDDDEIVCGAIRNYLLKTFPCLKDVWTAKDGEEAFQICREQKPDIVFTDIAMPKCGGLEFVKRIHEIDFNPKVVIISAHENFSFAQDAVRLGVEDYLIKPILPGKIKEITQKILDKLNNYERLQQNINDMVSRYQENLPVLQERFFHALLYENMSEKRIMERAAAVELDFKGACYTTAVLKVEHYGKRSPIETEQFTDFLTKIADAVFPGKTKVYNVVMGGGNAVLFIMSKNPDRRSLFRIVNNSLNGILAGARKHYGVKLNGAVGRQYKSPARIRQSYQEALSAQNINEGKNWDTICNYEEVSSEKAIAYKPDGDLEHKLLQDVKYKTFQECSDLINQMGEQMRNVPYLKYEYIKTYFLKLAVLMHRDFQNANDGTALPETDFNQLLQTQEMDECMEWFRPFVSRIIYAYQELNEEKGSVLVNKAKHIINDHISDPEFNIDDVSADLYISANYLRQIFKQQSEETFGEYLIRIRMEKAKDILKTPDIKIHEIAEATGFSNQRYFAVCFKKRFNQTPTEYREKCIVNFAENFHEKC